MSSESSTPKSALFTKRDYGFPINRCDRKGSVGSIALPNSAYATMAD
jgi:hypothetical protein